MPPQNMINSYGLKVQAQQPYVEMTDQELEFLSANGTFNVGTAAINELNRRRREKRNEQSK